MSPLRWMARLLGVLAGAAVGGYGLALFALRCFDTCPTDPAEDLAIMMLVICLVCFGIVIISAALTVATRAAGAGLVIALILGSVIAVFSTISAFLVPKMKFPDYSWLIMSLVALFVGVATVWVAELRRRQRRSSP